MTTSVIRTERLTKTYGEHRGIVDVDLEVAEGEVFGFLGPNGAGKTTTIRTLLDLIRPTSGKAFVFGIESTVDPVAIHRRIGYIPGEFALYDRLTGARPSSTSPTSGAASTRATRRRSSSASSSTARRSSRTTARATSRRWASIIALQHRPELLILDEPTSGLDPLVQQTFFALAPRGRHRRRDDLPLVATSCPRSRRAATASRSSATAA